MRYIIKWKGNYVKNEFHILIFELINTLRETKEKIRFIVYFYSSFKFIFRIYPNKELINFTLKNINFIFIFFNFYKLKYK